MKKIIDLAKKLNELKKRGIGGEKDNAAEMLEVLLQKHDISLEDIEGEQVKSRSFKVKNRRLFIQIASMVLGQDCRVYRHKGERGKLILDVTDSQFIEIDTMYSFYQNEYTKQLKKFVSAFVMKNNLYPETSDDGTELTPKELARLFEIAQMAQGIDKSHFLKQIK